MANIADLVVSLSADIASFRSGMEEASDHLAAIRQQSSDAGSALSTLSNVIENVVSVEAIRRIADFGAQLVESAAQIGHLSAALGISAETYQGLAYAAQEAGVPADAFAGIMEKLQKNLELLATGGGGPAAKVFADLGLSATNADGSLRSAADTLEDLAHNKIFNAESSAEKLAQVMIITGARMGDATLIVNALKGSLGDLTAVTKQAQDAGLAYSDATVAGAEQMETKLTAIWTRIKVAFGTAIVSAYEDPFAALASAGHSLASVPTQPGANAPTTGSKPPGPAVVDPTQAKQLQSFQETYQKLLQTEQQDADYQAQLRVAYQQGAAAVAQVEAAHAADKAQLELLEAAQRDHVTATQAEINAVRDAAAANAMNTKAAAEQKQIEDALTASQKKYTDQVTAVMTETDGLTEKQNKLADALGILEQQLVSGDIQWDEYVQRAKAAQQVIDSIGADKGMEEFTKGLSSDLDTALGKMTDFSAMIEEKQKTKGKDSIFSQLEQDANDFTASLEKMLLKLLIINPLLNTLGLGGQGNGKQLPTLFGNSGGPGGGAGTTSPFSAIGSSIEGGGKSVLSFLGGLFGGESGPASSVDADSATGASLNSDIVDALSGGALGGAGGFDMGFASGGDFTVAGSGGTDTQRVSFLATPGERVSVMPEVASRGRSAGADSGGGGRGGPININMPISGVHADTFRATQNQITGDLTHAISTARRYAK
jgi:hypothetical protein